MAKQKTYILKIIFISLIFFAFSNVASAITGSIDISVENQVKVCKDNTCAKPTPGIIYFKVSSDSPLIIDTEKGLSGKVWGDELGWITFNPPYGGVFFADSATGLLKGTAWSENSGAINFSVTGQKVVIDPKTGEWNGWAWASGPYGGWIKFDCKNNSCIRTVWNKERPASPSAVGQATSPASSSTIKINENKGLTWISDIQAITGKVLNDFSSSFTNLFDGTGQLISNTFDSLSQAFSNTYNSMAVFLANILPQNSLVNKNEPAVSPSSPKLGLGENIKNVFQEKSAIMTDNFNALVTSSADLFNQMTNVKYQIFDKAGDGYYTFSSNLINFRSSVLEGVNNLFK